MCVRSVAGVKHVRSRGHLCVWAFIRVNAVFARVCVRVCWSDFNVCACIFVVWRVCQVCKEPLICCPELVNNWHLLSITSSVKQHWVLIHSFLCTLAFIRTMLPSLLLCICLYSVWTVNYLLCCQRQLIVIQCHTKYFSCRALGSDFSGTVCLLKRCPPVPSCSGASHRHF